MVFGRLFAAVARHPARIVPPIGAGATVEAVAVIDGHLPYRGASVRTPAPVDPGPAIHEGSPFGGAPPLAGLLDRGWHAAKPTPRVRPG